ncbi:MAG: S24 family peptidase, partial [Acidobacteriota bacterium]
MAPIATQTARLYLLTAEVPGHTPVTAGVLLHDPAGDGLYLRLRRDWETFAPAADSQVLAELQDDLEAKAAEMGAGRLLAYLNQSLSNVVRISEPQDVLVEDYARALGRLYRQHVDAQALPFVTHLPRYSLAVAAGKFLENEEVSDEGWEEAPVGLRLTPDMFVARIQGRSMEPRIPDDSLCLFRSGVTGSRQGRLVLVEYLGGGTNDRHTVKRYTSEKLQRPDGTWTHERIRLEPLNPEFDAWDLDAEEDRFRIVAEFVQVL